MDRIDNTVLDDSQDEFDNPKERAEAYSRAVEQLKDEMAEPGMDEHRDQRGDKR